MNIELISLSKDNDVNDIKVFDFTSDFYLRLSESDFSRIGASLSKKIIIDGENVDMRMVDLSSFIRETIIRFLEGMFVEVSNESFDKLGCSPSKEEFQEYTCDLKELGQLIVCLRKNEFTHLKRM